MKVIQTNGVWKLYEIMISLDMTVYHWYVTEYRNHLFIIIINFCLLHYIVIALFSCNKMRNGGWAKIKKKRKKEKEITFIFQNNINKPLVVKCFFSLFTHFSTFCSNEAPADPWECTWKRMVKKKAYLLCFCY